MSITASRPSAGARALDVDGEDVVDRVLADLVPRRLLGGHVADVVDEHVDVAGLVGHPPDVVPLGDVALNEAGRRVRLLDPARRRLGAAL